MTEQEQAVAIEQELAAIIGRVTIDAVRMSVQLRAAQATIAGLEQSAPGAPADTEGDPGDEVRP